MAMKKAVWTGQSGPVPKRRSNARSKVTWVKQDDGNVAKPALNNRHFFREGEPTAMHKQILSSGALRPGALFVLGVNLMDAYVPDGCYAPPFPYTVYQWSSVAPFKAGTFVLYAGTCRVEEVTNAGVVVSALRHTFILGGGRRIISLNFVDPA